VLYELTQRAAVDPLNERAGTQHLVVLGETNATAAGTEQEKFSPSRSRCGDYNLCWGVMTTMWVYNTVRRDTHRYIERREG
jgi:hypothetical protein